MGAAGSGTPNVELSARAMGATIRALRAHADISQTELGQRVGMHANYIGAIERGEILSPGLDTVARIANDLGVSVAVLAESYAAATVRRVNPTHGRAKRVAPAYDAKALGKAIRLIRRLLGLTQEQLAEEVGLHRNHLGSIETGERTTRGIATIARVAHGLSARLGTDEPSLLPLLAQAFTREVTLAQVLQRVASKTFRTVSARSPQASADS